MSPLLLTLLLLHTFDSSTTVSTRSGGILNSSPRRTRDISGEEEEASVSESLLDSTFCLDSLGVKRGLFTRWIDPHGCECSCNPTGKFAVIICDESCSGASTGSESGTLEHALELSDITRDKGNQKFCGFTVNGFRYQDGQVWMSPDSPCIQCRCTNGEVDCSASALHCRSACLTHQETSYTGPCCEQKCIDKDNVTPQTPSPCLGLNDQTMYRHGDIQIRHEECVDQRCQCINGDWFCLDFCTPLENMTCPREERIYWDKFCCPRCKGQKSCSISVPVSSWVESPPDKNSKKLFVSLADREPKNEKERGLRLGQRVRRRAAVHRPLTTPKSSGQPLLSKEVEESLNGDQDIRLIHVEPGMHVAHTDGRCVCLDGEFRCSRPGPGIWHDTDCYYSDGESSDYYALGSKWTAHNDVCMQCQCLPGRTYACSRTPCQSLFLCPAGQTAVAANGECCPNLCVDIEEDRNRTHQTPTAFRARIPSHSTDKQIDSMDDILPYKNVKGHCKPLGYPHSDERPSPSLPVRSAVIIRRPCIDLQCVCQPTGEWTCVDYCTPCSAGETPAPNQRNHTIIELGADGCCLPCASTTSSHPRTSTNNSTTSQLTAVLEHYTRTVTICLILLIFIPIVAICVCCLCPVSKLCIMQTPAKSPFIRRIWPYPVLKQPTVVSTANAAVLVASSDQEHITDNPTVSYNNGLTRRLSAQSDDKLAACGSRPEALQSTAPRISSSKRISKPALVVSAAASDRHLSTAELAPKAVADPAGDDQPEKQQNHAENEDAQTPVGLNSLNGLHSPTVAHSPPARPSTLPGSVARQPGLRPVQHYFFHLPSVRQRASSMKQPNGLNGPDNSDLQTPNGVESRDSRFLLHAGWELPELSPVPPPKPPIPNFPLTDMKSNVDSSASVKPSDVDFIAVAGSLNELAPYCTGV